MILFWRWICNSCIVSVPHVTGDMASSHWCRSSAVVCYHDGMRSFHGGHQQTENEHTGAGTQHSTAYCATRDCRGLEVVFRSEVIRSGDEMMPNTPSGQRHVANLCKGKSALSRTCCVMLQVGRIVSNEVLRQHRMGAVLNADQQLISNTISGFPAP